MTDSAWHPGSFTKNFSWGEDRGLRDLHEVIKVGFDNRLEDVPRRTFEERVSNTGRLSLVPTNFFLFNKIKNGINFLSIDELVFQALNFRHSAHFDRLALFAFNLSNVGVWKRALPYQNTPALWAKHYIMERLGQQFAWDTKKINANDIEDFITGDSRYVGKTSRKLSTNLAHLYKIGKIEDFRSRRAERWWLSSIFLTLDRVTEGMILEGRIPEESRYEEYLILSGFSQLSGLRSIEKDLAAHHFIDLYKACGGISRFSEQAALERQRILLPEILSFANNPEPVGVFHPSNPRARGAIPRACAMLAQYRAGFEWIDLDDLENFDVERFVKQRTQDAVNSLKLNGVKPNITAEELLRMTRGK